MSGPHPALRILGRIVPAVVVAALWLLPAALFVTGFILWIDRHALARDGVVHQATVERCDWKSLHRDKAVTGSRGGGGYYSCHYVYRTSESGPAYTGYFQDAREWKAGEAIAIRYRPDQPATSATETDVAHPSLAPGAMMLLPLLYACWQAREPLRRWLRSTRPPPSPPGGLRG